MYVVIKIRRSLLFFSDQFMKEKSWSIPTLSHNAVRPKKRPLTYISKNTIVTKNAEILNTL